MIRLIHRHHLIVTLLFVASFILIPAANTMAAITNGDAYYPTTVIDDAVEIEVEVEQRNAPHTVKIACDYNHCHDTSTYISTRVISALYITDPQTPSWRYNKNIFFYKPNKLKRPPRA